MLHAEGFWLRRANGATAMYGLWVLFSRASAIRCMLLVQYVKMHAILTQRTVRRCLLVHAQAGAQHMTMVVI